ncbi:DUF1648 domain-containing protein [Kitasatospora sp. NPDC048540]|uniref:DUF1648 domain-containing protein n=1 Tax=Kitasatospora sp. NPDC048540 TaxID=3155634 RepID=UPI0033DEF9E8
MTVTVVVSGAIVPVVVLVLAWLAPAMADPGLPFGVRIPAAHRDAAVIGEQRRSYRRLLALGGGSAVAVGAVLAAVLPDPAAVATAVTAVVAAVGATAHVRARRAIRSAKEREGWYRGLRQGVSVDTSLRTRPVRAPWPWAAPAALLIALTAALAVARYPGMPGQLPTHFGADGTADRFAAKSLTTAFAPVLAQLGLTGLLGLTVRLALRGRADLDPADPAGSAARHRRYLRRTSAALLVLAALVDLSVLLAAVRIWRGEHTVEPAELLAPVLLGLAVLVVVAVRTGQGGSRLDRASARPEPGPGPEPGLVHVDDGHHWRLAGTVYVNRRDPALLVPKRLGVGWTLNLGNPRTLLLAALCAGFALAMSLI